MLIATLLFSFVDVYAQDAKTIKREIREITLTGGGYELGLQHGQQLKSEIAEIVSKWKSNTTENFGKDAELVLDDFFEYANFTESIRRWTPELYDEVRGIADGSGQPFRDIFILNLLDEFWVYDVSLQHHHCSGLGIPATSSSPGYVAQNMDIESYTDGYQVLMRIEGKEGEVEQLVLTHPGLIALNGMNSMGVGVCVNTLMQLNAANNGLPVAFIVRRIIGSTDQRDILNFVQNIRHASGQNYLIGIRGDIFDFEASAREVIRFDPGNLSGAITHTNHPLANKDIKPYFIEPESAQQEMTGGRNTNSTSRYNAVNSRISSQSNVTVEMIKDALRSKDDPDNPVCRNLTGAASGFTFASVIMILSGDPYMLVTAGPPDESEYKKYSFSAE